MFASGWIGAATSTVNHLVMPRMRATASAFYILMATVGLALWGPCMVGEVSDVLTGGMSAGETLGSSLMLSTLSLVIPLVLLLLLLLKRLGPGGSKPGRARTGGGGGDPGRRLAAFSLPTTPSVRNTHIW